MVIPRALCDRVLTIAHEGHKGIVKTKARLRSKVWWPKVDNETVQGLSWLPGGERVWAPRANFSSLTSYLQRPDFTNTLVDVMTSFRPNP